MEFKKPIQKKRVEDGTPVVIVSRKTTPSRPTKSRFIRFNRSAVKDFSLQKSSRLSFSKEDNAIFVIFNPTVDIPSYKLIVQPNQAVISNADLVEWLLGGEVTQEMKRSFTFTHVRDYEGNKVYQLIELKE